METTALKAQFDLHTRMFNNVLKEISEEEANIRINAHSNNMKWIVGHIVNARINNMHKIVGLQPNEALFDKFSRGTILDEKANYLSLEELKTLWNETSTQLGEHILNMPSEVLVSKAPIVSPIPNDTVLGLIAFFITHESHHLGQLYILRKMLGKEGANFREQN